MKAFGTRLVKKLDSQILRLRLLSLFDQILFSAGNFVLTVLLARFYTDSEVSAYGIGLAISLLVQSTQRTCYLIQASLLPAPIFVKRLPKIMGQHLVTWACLLGGELLLMAGALVLYPSVFHIQISLAVLVTTLIYAQLAFDRIVLLKTGRVLDPLLASLAFLLLNGALFFAAPIWNIPFFAVMSLVGLYAASRIVRLIALTGKPDLFWGWRLMKRANRKRLPSAVLGTAGASGFSEIPVFVLGALSSPAQTAAFVATRGLVQPLSIVVRSLDVIDKNFFQHSSVHGKFLGLREAFLRQGRIYVTLSVLTFLGSILLGREIVEFFYGTRYVAFWTLMIGWAAYFSFSAISNPLETAIVKSGNMERYNRLRLVAGAIGVLFSVFLCPRYGAYGAMVGSVLGWVASVAIGVLIVRKILFPVKEV